MPVVSVDGNNVIQEIDGSIFGINHRYAFNGYGTYDQNKSYTVFPDRNRSHLSGFLHVSDMLTKWNENIIKSNKLF